MARTRWAVGPGNPGLLPRPGRSDRQRRWVPGAGPGRQIDLKTARTASADSEVRPGPRPQTLRPYQAKTSEAGPEALSTSSLPIRDSYVCIGISEPRCTEQACYVWLRICDAGRSSPSERAQVT